MFEEEESGILPPIEILGCDEALDVNKTITNAINSFEYLLGKPMCRQIRPEIAELRWIIFEAINAAVADAAGSLAVKRFKDSQKATADMFRGILAGAVMRDDLGKDGVQLIARIGAAFADGSNLKEEFGDISNSP